MWERDSSKISSFILLWRILDEQSILLFEPILYWGTLGKQTIFRILNFQVKMTFSKKKFRELTIHSRKSKSIYKVNLKLFWLFFSKIIKSPVRPNWWTKFELFRSCWFALFVVYRKPSELGEFLFTVARLSSWWYKDYRSILKCEHTFIYVDPKNKKFLGHAVQLWFKLIHLKVSWIVLSLPARPEDSVTSQPRRRQGFRSGLILTGSETLGAENADTGFLFIITD